MADPNHRFIALQERKHLTQQLIGRPYSCITYIVRASCYGKLGYPDLAIGDAYRALLITDEIENESFEYHEQALQSYVEDVADGDPLEGLFVEPTQEEINYENQEALNGCKAENSSDKDSDSAIGGNVEKLRIKCFACLSDYLCQCGCLRSAYDFVERGLQIDPNNPILLDQRRNITQLHNKKLLEKDPDWTHRTYNSREELPNEGYARRELYPWNDHEPDRFSEESLQFLNEQLNKGAPKCEVRAVSLPILQSSTPSYPSSKSPATIKQLGVFAKEDIAPHETVLQERSLLTANNRLHDPLCDACSAPLPPISTFQEPLPTCPECDDIIFCSETCYSLATTLYHPAVCGKPDLEAIAKDPSPLAATNALYLLLLGRTYALAETQNIHPLDLTETKYLWGDFTPPSLPGQEQEHARQLPFTFEDNILAPLHLLMKMDIDIFASLATTDTWIISTLFAKFRGVASARMDPRTGMPEVCAVHPMWCLANHSCAPNVKWEWSGDIKFEARGGEDVVRWGDDDGKEGGIKKGEEVLNHYCDIDLMVKERREWAAGALGGNCVCERCMWEEAEEKKQVEGETWEERKEQD
ncbi:MAG: hypothetical protein Q9209_005645 [Squamulea sp. 1 TL-2023]